MKKDNACQPRKVREVRIHKYFKAVIERNASMSNYEYYQQVKKYSQFKYRIYRRTKSKC